MAARKAKAKKKAKKTRKAKRPHVKRVAGKSATPKGGRGEIEFPDDVVEQIHLLVGMGAPLADVAVLSKVSKSTLERRAATEGHPVQIAVSSGMAQRHTRLRLFQWKNAEGGNAIIQRWLGIQELGQRDYQRLEHSGPDGGPVEVARGDYGDLLIAKIIEAQQGHREIDVDLPLEVPQ